MTLYSSQGPWHLIADCLAKRGVTTPDYAVEFFKEIAAPEHLACLLRIAENLCRVLPIGKITSSGLPAFDGKQYLLDQGEKICDELVRNRTTYVAVVPGVDRPERTPGVAPLRKEHDAFPIYTLLWYRIPDDIDESGDLSGRYYQLQAQILTTDISLRSRAEDSDTAQLKGARISTCRHARALARLGVRYGKGYVTDRVAVLQALPKASLRTAEYLRELRDAMARQGITAGQKERIERIAAFLEHGLGKDLTKRETGKFRELSRRPFDRGLITPDVDPNEASYQVELGEAPSMPDDEAKQLSGAGCSIHETGGRLDSFTVKARADESTSALGVMDRLRSQFRYGTSWLPMQNQQLPYAWSRLSLFERRELILALERLRVSNVVYGEVPAKELAAILATVFLRACPMEALARFKLELYHRGSPKSGMRGFRFRYDAAEQRGAFVVPPGRPKVKALSKSQEGYAYSGIKEIEFSSGTGIEVVIEEYIRSSTPNLRHNKRLFPRDINNYEAAAKEFLDQVNRERNTRITTARIGRCLFDAVAEEQGGDRAAAMIAFSRDDVLGTVPLHYTALSGKYLRRLYRRVCASMIAADIGLDEAQGTLDLREEVGGSRYRPLGQKIREFTDSLRRELSSARQAAESLSPEKVRGFHNAFVVYTVMLVMYCTGFRAVTDPMFPIREVDRELGLACISDKGEHHARLVWLPQCCRQQFEHYRSHLTALRRFLFARETRVDRGVGEFLRTIPFRAGPSLVRRTFLFKNNPDQSEWKPVDVRPRSLNPYVAKHLPLPLNANRHHLRSRLLELGCDRNVIDAFIGHWERGREPWGSFSSLSPVYYKNELEKFLEQIVAEDGWSPEAGLGDG